MKTKVKINRNMYNDNEQLERFASHGKFFMWLLTICGMGVGLLAACGYGIYRLGWCIVHWDWNGSWSREKH